VKGPFAYWLPLYLREDHARKAKSFLRNPLLTISGSSSYSPNLALTILPKLMNTMVVQVMNGTVHASIKALEGYCWFHRLLLQAVLDSPYLQQEVETKINNFITNPERRTKRAVKALGEWLPLLSVSRRFTWQQVAVPYIQENLDRNVKWVIEKHPGLKRSRMPEGVADLERLDDTFDATKVSIKLCMFHVHFLRTVRPKDTPLEQVAKNYDAFYGMPSHETKEILQKEIFRIHEVSTWPEFFHYIGIKCPPAAVLTRWLVQAVSNSARKEYH